MIGEKSHFIKFDPFWTDLIQKIQNKTIVFILSLNVTTFILQRCRWVFKYGWASSNVVGIICPLVEIGLTEPSNSGWAKAHLAHPLTTSLNCTYVRVHLRWIWNHHYTRVTSFSKPEKQIAFKVLVFRIINLHV